MFRGFLAIWSERESYGKALNIVFGEIPLTTTKGRKYDIVFVVFKDNDNFLCVLSLTNMCQFYDISFTLGSIY